MKKIHEDQRKSSSVSFSPGFCCSISAMNCNQSSPCVNVETRLHDSTRKPSPRKYEATGLPPPQSLVNRLTASFASHCPTEISEAAGILKQAVSHHSVLGPSRRHRQRQHQGGSNVPVVGRGFLLSLPACCSSDRSAGRPTVTGLPPAAACAS